MEQLISIEKQKLEQIQEALEIAVLMLDVENQPPQFTLTKVIPKVEMALQILTELKLDSLILFIIVKAVINFL